MFGMLAVFAEFERDIIQQRTKAGLEAARKRGRIGGRPAIDPPIRNVVLRSYFKVAKVHQTLQKSMRLGEARFIRF